MASRGFSIATRRWAAGLGAALAGLAGPAAATGPPVIGPGVFDCTRVGIAGNLPSGTQMERLELDDMLYPDAICNDGSPAVLYFRPHLGAANANRWVIQLQGGGSCKDAQACADRWCSVGTGFSARQMSSLVDDHGFIDGKGLMDPREENPVGAWNHVFLRYCSSDSWTGNVRGRETEADHPVEGGTEPFLIHFLGQRILDAAIATLRDSPPVHTPSGVALPDLDAAEVVLFAGASAGGNGVLKQADRLGDELRTTNPTLAFRALIDSAFEPSLEGLDLSLTEACVVDGVCDWEAFSGLDTSTAFWGASLESSCVDHHATLADGSDWKCEDSTHVLRHHVTTPMFIRMGQEDELVAPGYEASGLAVPPQIPLTLPVFAARIRTELAELDEIQSTAEEGAEIAVVPGVFAPTCPEHETLRNRLHIFNTAIFDGEVPYAMFDVLENWITGADPAQLVTQPGDDELCAGARVPALPALAWGALAVALVASAGVRLREATGSR